MTGIFFTAQFFLVISYDSNFEPQIQEFRTGRIFGSRGLMQKIDFPTFHLILGSVGMRYIHPNGLPPGLQEMIQSPKVGRVGSDPASHLREGVFEVGWIFLLSEMLGFFPLGFNQWFFCCL